MLRASSPHLASWPNTVKLEKSEICTTETVQGYVDWVYTGQIVELKVFSTTAMTGPAHSPFTLAHMHLSQSYKLGELLEDYHFQDGLLDTMISNCLRDKRYPFHLTRMAFSVVPEGSPLRKLFVDMSVHKASMHNMVTHKEWFNREPIYEIMLGLAKRKNANLSRIQAPFEGGLNCLYHLHQEIDGVKACYLKRPGLLPRI